MAFLRAIIVTLAFCASFSAVVSFAQDFADHAGVAQDAVLGDGCTPFLVPLLKAHLAVRSATQADAESIVAFIMARRLELGLDPSYSADGRSVVDDLARLEEFYGRGTGKMFMLLNESALIGTAGFTRFAQNTCELKKIYLSPQWRNQGIGSWLLQMTLAQAKLAGCRHVQLQTRPEMTEALRAYERLGFVKDSALSSAGIWIYELQLD